MIMHIYGALQRKRRSLEALSYYYMHTTIAGSMTRPCKLICTKTIIDWHCLINKADIHNIVMSSALVLFYYKFSSSFSFYLSLVSVRLVLAMTQSPHCSVILFAETFGAYRHRSPYTYSHTRSHIFLHLFKFPRLL